MIWLKAIIAVVLTPALLGAIYYFFLSFGSDAPFNQAVFLITILFSYVLVVLIGLPSVLAFRSQESLPLQQCVFVGAFVSLMTAFLMFGLSAMLPPLSQLMIFGFLGGVAGTVVWYVFK